MSSNDILRVRESDNFVWDTGTLAWVKMTQAAGGGGGGAVTIADGADVNAGTIGDLAVTGNTAGTVSAKLRGINQLLQMLSNLTNALLSSGSDRLLVNTTGRQTATFGTLNFIGDSVSIVLLDAALCAIQLDDAGTLVGTIEVFGLAGIDLGGASAQKIFVRDLTTNALTTVVVPGRIYLANTAGLTQLYLVVTAYTSGSVDAEITPTYQGTINLPPATQPISATSLPLPTGASTSARQDTEIASLASIDTKLTSQATAALQATGNASLAAIDADLDVALSTRASEASLAKLPLAQGTSMIGASGAMVQAGVVDRPTSFTPGEVRPMTMAPDGRLRVDAVIDAEDAWNLGDPFGYLASTPVAEDFVIGAWNA